MWKQAVAVQDDWCFVEKPNGERGFVPAALVSHTDGGEQCVLAKGEALAVAPYRARSETELSIERGQRLAVIAPPNEQGWVHVKLITDDKQQKEERTGFVPAENVVMLSDINAQAGGAAQEQLKLKDPLGMLPSCPFFAEAVAEYKPLPKPFELALTEHERVVALRFAERGWVLVKKDNKSFPGFVPREWLKVLPGTPNVVRTDPSGSDVSDEDEEDEEEAGCTSESAASHDTKGVISSKEDVDVTPFQYREVGGAENLPCIGWFVVSFPHKSKDFTTWHQNKQRAGEALVQAQGQVSHLLEGGGGRHRQGYQRKRGDVDHPVRRPHRHLPTVCLLLVGPHLYTAHTPIFSLFMWHFANNST